MAESPEFARVLLRRLRLQSERRARIVRNTLAAVIPGYGLLAFHRVFRATMMIACASLIAAPWLEIHAPFAYHAWPGLGAGAVSPIVPLAGWILIYANSLIGYLAQGAREARRSQVSTSTHRGRPRSSDRITAQAA